MEAVIYDLFLAGSLVSLIVLFYDRVNWMKFSSDWRDYILSLIPLIFLVSLSSAFFSVDYKPLFALSLSVFSASVYLIIYELFSAEASKITGSLSSLAAFLFLVYLSPVNLFSTKIIFEIILIASLALTPIIGVFYVLELDKSVLMVVFTHFIDASSTIVALRKGLIESRFLARTFIDLLGQYGVILMKALFFIPIGLYLVKEEEKRYKLLFSGITAYGLVLGIRNYFLILIA